MIQLSELKSLLEIEENDLKKLDDDQLKVLVGCLRYASRVVTREVNKREILINK